MGNTETINTNNRQVQVLHQKFKMVEVMENMQEMILTIPYEQKSDIVEWEKLLKNVKDCDPQFLLMPKKYMITEEGLCGSSGVIKIVYDCFIYSFEEEIRNHSEKFKYFQESEVWYLLFAIISGVKQMDRLSMKVGDIRPHNIFVNQNGQVKLAGVYSWPKEVENYLKTSYDKVVTYLSPEQLHICRVGEKGKRSHIVGESFSVGLTLLHTCLLKELDELYNVKKYEFNVQKLQYEINELKKLTYWNQQKGTNEKYSQQLIHIITGLLEIDETKRLSTLDLFNELEPHAQEILNLREFQIPKFGIDTPIKQQHQSILVSSLEHHRSSPQYSSIQKKEFNQPQSIAFQSNYPIGLISTKEANTIQQSVNRPFIAQRKTPQKRTQSKQKMQMSITNQRSSLFSKTQQIPQIPRQSVSRQKFNSNLQPNYSLPNTQVKNNGIMSQVPSTYQYTAQFKTYDNQFQPFRPVTGSNYPQGNQRKYQAPPLNYTTSSYVNSQQRYEMPSQPLEYRPLVNAPNLNYVQAQTPQFTYKPSIPQNQTINFSTGGGYPFTKNIQFTKSDYTVFEQSKIGTQFSHRPSITGANQQGSNYTSNIYQTSTVKPVVPGQTIFGTGTQTKISSEPSQLLKRIDQQLNKSKQMYSNGTTF